MLMLDGLPQEHMLLFGLRLRRTLKCVAQVSAGSMAVCGEKLQCCLKKLTTLHQRLLPKDTRA